MLKAKKTPKNKQVSMLIVIGGCLLVTTYLLYTTFIQKEGENPASQLSGYLFGMSKVTLPPLPDIDKHAKLFQEEKLQSLKNFSRLPIESGLVGRQNPFEELVFSTSTGPINK